MVFISQVNDLIRFNEPEYLLGIETGEHPKVYQLK